MSSGSAAGLYCPACGDPCADPRRHLATQQNSTMLLTPDSPCKNYAETNKWGRRWRVIEAFAHHELRFFVDDMGPEDSFTVRMFAIPSMGDDPHEWNTFGECMDIAIYKHDPTTKRYERRQVPPATGRQWAEQLVEQNEYIALWRQGRSVYGPAVSTQRSKDWVR